MPRELAWRTGPSEGRLQENEQTERGRLIVSAARVDGRQGAGEKGEEEQEEEEAGSQWVRPRPISHFHLFAPWN